MFPNQIQADEDVVGIIELVYPKALYPISPSMELNTREKWVFFSPMRVVRVCNFGISKSEYEE